MKKRRILATIMSAAMLATTLVGCGSEEAADQQVADTQEVEQVAEQEETPAQEDTQESDTTAELPAYEYPGPEAFYSAVYAYIVDELGSQYSQGDVCIPSINEVYLDDSDNSDIKYYAAFEVYNYTLEGDTLMTQSGGAHPGVMHLKYSEVGYEVTGFDAVADGSDFDPTAKEYFGKYYDDFMKVYSDSDAKEATRAQIIANYVAANSLNITKYQDYGWDPVELPEENIDSFYSQLD